MVHVSIEDAEAAKDNDEIAKEAVVDDHFAKSNKKKPFTKRRKEGYIKSVTGQAGAEEWWYSEFIDALISSRSFSSRRLAEEIELLNSAGR